MELLIKIKKMSFFVIFIAFSLSLLLFPEMAEASRGGSRGGTLLWIPFAIVAGIIFFINKNIPELWSIIAVHLALFFLACLGAIFLEWADFINHEDIFTSSVVIFILIIVYLRSTVKSKKNS